MTPPGISSVPGLEGWLAANVMGEPVTVTDIQLIAGGRSNLTYRLTAASEAGTRDLVLRRPPLGHVLPTAHDMSREFRVISALAGTDVPVAGAIAYCADADVVGAPFYLMDYVPGQVLRTGEDTRALTAAQNRNLSERLADMLAAIHGVDVAAAGLGDLGKGSGYLRRQLDRWQRQWELSKTREVPGYDELVVKLTGNLPAEGEVTLVHGDFRIDNVLVDVDAAKILAVVDWEMATLGDPLADLGLTLVYWTDPGEESYLPRGEGLNIDATTSPGFLTRAEFASGYASRTGRDVSLIGYYMAFAYFKLAVVLEGINARYLQHQTVGEGFEREGGAVPILIARAHETL
jgi:aminoglycoside phosphotransferase (APT) family kinase protein